MKRSLIAAAVLLTGVSAVAAQQEILSARIAIMKANARTMYGNLNAINRGTKPYDQAAVDAALAQLSDSVPKITGLYPDNTKGLKSPDSDYSANPKLWDNKADFEAKGAAVVKAIADAKGKITDAASLKANYTTINDACNACHELYRVQN